MASQSTQWISWPAWPSRKAARKSGNVVLAATADTVTADTVRMMWRRVTVTTRVTMSIRIMMRNGFGVFKTPRVLPGP